MFTSKRMMSCLLGTLILSAGLAYADEEQAATKDWHVTLSAKAWNESWSTWQYLNTTPVNGPVGTTTDTGNSAAALIGGVTVKYKDIFLSGNYSPQTSFTFPDVGQTYTRSEEDFNFGYYLNPQVGISVGYKQVKIGYSSQSNWTYKFMTLGLNSSARIGESSFFMYENGALSLTGSTDLSPSPAAAFQTAGLTKGTPTYRSLEAGFGFSATKNLIFTMGYKFQQVEAPFTGSIDGVTENTRDTTNGFIFGTAYTF